MIELWISKTTTENQPRRLCVTKRSLRKRIKERKEYCKKSFRNKMSWASRLIKSILYPEKKMEFSRTASVTIPVKC